MLVFRSIIHWQNFCIDHKRTCNFAECSVRFQLVGGPKHCTKASLWLVQFNSAGKAQSFWFKRHFFFVFSENCLKKKENSGTTHLKRRRRKQRASNYILIRQQENKFFWGFRELGRHYLLQNQKWQKKKKCRGTQDPNVTTCPHLLRTMNKICSKVLQNQEVLMLVGFLHRTKE